MPFFHQQKVNITSVYLKSVIPIRNYERVIDTYCEIDTLYFVY